MASIDTMDAPHSSEIVSQFQEFYESYCGDDIEALARSYPDGGKSLYLDWEDLYRFDRDIAEDYIAHPGRMRDHAEQALTGLKLPDEEDLLFTDVNVRATNPPMTTKISELSVPHQGNLVAVEGTVVDANEPEPELQDAAFECQRCGTLSYIPQRGGFTEPHQCEGCEREGPFNINFEQSEFVTAQTLRIREGPSHDGTHVDELEIVLTDDEPTQVYEGEPVRVTGILRFKQKEQDSVRFGKYLDGVTLERGDGPEPADWGTEYLGVERSPEKLPGDKELLYEFVGRSRHILNTQDLEWEHEVREKIIAPFLHALGWNVYDSEVSIEHTGDDLDARPDYALLDPEGATAAIIEAKALGKINRDARHQI
jgi:DNA replicative helicase MCM subunit Mcm2 (Cdc46/Mcm family)